MLYSLEIELLIHAFVGVVTNKLKYAKQAYGQKALKKRQFKNR